MQDDNTTTNARPERKTKTCDPSWHWHEPHRKPIYQVAFNQADASQADVFAVVGARWVSIYRMPLTESPSHTDTAGTAAEKNGRKRKTPSAAAAMGRLEPLQTYADDDTEESLYCVAWGEDPSSGNAWLAVAGKRRQIRLIDCHRGTALRTMRGHGGAVHEVRFIAHAQASLLVSASEDESVRLWCCSTAYCLAIFAGQQGHRDAVLSLDVRPDAAYLATAGVDGTVRVWSLRDEALQRRMAEVAAAAPSVAAAEAEAAAVAQVAAALKGAEEAAAAEAEEVEEVEEVEEEEVEVEIEVDSAPRRTRHSGSALTPGSGGEDGGGGGAPAEPPLPAAPAAPAVSPTDHKRAKLRGVPRKDDSGGAPEAAGSAVRTRDSRSVLEAARAAAQEAKGATAAAARAVRAAEEIAMRGFAPPARVQLPVATVEGLHFEGGEGVSYYVDCVRWVGQLLLTRGTDERAVLWAPPPLDGQRPSWRPASSSPCTPFSAAAPGSAVSGFASSGSVATARGSVRSPRSPPAPTSAAGERRLAAPVAATGRPAALPTLLNEWRMPSSSLWFLRCSLDPARRLLALGSTQGCVGVCEVDAVRAPPLVRCVARRGGGRKRACALVTVRHTAFSPDASHLVGGCDDGSVYIWRLGSAVDDATA